MDGTLGGMDSANIVTYAAIAWAVIEVAKRVASLTPGKDDDQIVSKVERVLRSLVDALAGNHTDRSDQSLIKTKKKVDY